MQDIYMCMYIYIYISFLVLRKEIELGSYDASVDLGPLPRQLWTSLIVGRGATLNSKVYVVEHGHLDSYVFQGSCIIPCALLD